MNWCFKCQNWKETNKEAFWRTYETHTLHIWRPSLTYHKQNTVFKQKIYILLLHLCNSYHTWVIEDESHFIFTFKAAGCWLMFCFFSSSIFLVFSFRFGFNRWFRRFCFMCVCLIYFLCVCFAMVGSNRQQSASWEKRYFQFISFISIIWQITQTITSKAIE